MEEKSNIIITDIPSIDDSRDAISTTLMPWKICG